MLRRTMLAAGALALVAALTIPAANAAAPVAIEAKLKGAEEVPGPGDANGRGGMQAAIKIKQRKFCFTLSWKRLDSGPLAGHIHKGRQGIAGPIRLKLFQVADPLPNPAGVVEGCVKARRKKLRRIKRYLPGYYVNIHNETHPDGAIRGQLKLAP